MHTPVHYLNLFIHLAPNLRTTTSLHKRRILRQYSLHPPLHPHLPPQVLPKLPPRLGTMAENSRLHFRTDLDLTRLNSAKVPAEDDSVGRGAEEGDEGLRDEDLVGEAEKVEEGADVDDIEAFLAVLFQARKRIFRKDIARSERHIPTLPLAVLE